MQAEVSCWHLSGIAYEVAHIAVSQVAGMFSRGAVNKPIMQHTAT